MYNRRYMRGVTLIELMIVIAGVAILVALAVPAYTDYTIRSKVAECINQASVPKLAISEFVQSNGAFPSTADQAGFSDGGTVPKMSQYCESFTYYRLGLVGLFDVTVDTPAVGQPTSISRTSSVGSTW